MDNFTIPQMIFLTPVAWLTISGTYVLYTLVYYMIVPYKMSEEEVDSKKDS